MYVDIINHLESCRESCECNRQWSKFYKIENDILLQRDFHLQDRYKICIPPSLVPVILKGYHDNYGHFGVDKCIALISKAFMWKGIRKDVKDWIRDCLVCMRTKYNRHPAYSANIPIIPDGLRDLVFLDLIGPKNQTKMAASTVQA